MSIFGICFILYFLKLSACRGLYTEIFPKADTKKRHFLPTKDRYSSARCVIIKDKAWCLKILPKTLLEFVFLG